MDRILVGLDASPRSQQVLTAAEHLAKRAGGKLLLFRAIGLSREIPPEAYAMSPTEIADLVRGKAQQYLDDLLAALPEEVRLGAIAAIGVPWQAICDAAKQHKVDLIMIGSHGYAGLDRLTGTTAAKVVDHATCSVLVVRNLDV
jgi:nucleotide-binding universal stress UspA family protein